MKRFFLWFLPGLIAGALIILGGGKALHMTSTNEYCVSCHIHPLADAAWKKSVHYDTRSGYRIGCADCHLPPKGKGYFMAKAKTGLRDLWNKWTKSPSYFNWADKGRLEVARGYVMRTVVLTAIRIFSLQNFQKQERMHTFIICRQKKQPNLTALIVILIKGILSKDIPMEAILRSGIHLLPRKKYLQNLQKLPDLKISLNGYRNQRFLSIC